MGVPVPEALEGPSERLTETERRILAYYFKSGGSAKEVAQKLGVAPRTVYKAHYKYKKNLRLLGIDPDDVYGRKSTWRCTRRGYSPIPIEELKRAVREVLEDLAGVRYDSLGMPSKSAELLASRMEELAENLARLSRSIERLASAISSGGLAECTMPASSVEHGELPSFVAGNPWLGVLMSRGLD